MDSAVVSLPYYDRDIEHHPGLREKAEQAIAKELAAQPTLSSSNVPKLPQLFTQSPLLQTAFQRTSTSAIPVPEDGFDSKRYTIIPPAADASEEEWQKAFDTASATLEHQYLRSANIELLNKFGANSWRISNFLLEKDVDRLAKETEQVQLQIEDINRGRKHAQTEAGKQLNSLETKWTTLVSGNLQLEIANIQLQAELEQLRAREQELKAKLASFD